MIDFQNGVFVKLGPSDPAPIAAELAPILVEGDIDPVQLMVLDPH